VATGAVFALSDLSGDAGFMAATVLLVAYTIGRTLRPFPRIGDLRIGRTGLLVDLGVALGAVAFSGGWGSPYVFTLLVGVLLAGLAYGYAVALGAAGAAAAGLGMLALAVPSARTPVEAAAQIALVYGATAVVAGYARRLFLEAEASQAAFTDRLSGLTEANALLSQLTRVAQTLPASLDLGDTLAAAMGHLRQLFDFTGAAILVLDSATGTWRPEAATGLTAPGRLAADELPAALREMVAAAPTAGQVIDVDLSADPEGPGLWPGSGSGLYAVLAARDRLVALVVLEHTEAGHFGPREREVLAGLAEPLALAIDNGLWFDRLRMLGAEGERDRLARNLHDRIAQGLAYVALELDRLARLPDSGAELLRLRQDVGGLLGEVRETLRQLRSRVTEQVGLAGLAEGNLPRFAERTGIATRYSGGGGGRLPVPVEQELWRILQEALSNVERHSEAKSVDVNWSCDGRHARLEIADDGCGFRVDKVDEAFTSGLMAMRERANAIGARLAVESDADRGTRIVVDVEVAPG
jgi:signal transduction histidine kinase